VVEASGHTPEGRLISESLAPGDTFVDVGANHGAYSVFAARLVGEQGKVLAFEPQPRLAGLLRASLDENNACRWEVHEIACGAEPSHAEFYCPSSGSGSAGLFRAFSAKGEHTTHRVQIALLDDVVDADALPGNIFIKVDIEGSELKFLRGAGKLIRTRRPTILIELNPDAASCAGHSTKAVLDELESLGYMTFSTPFAYPERMHRCDINTKKQQNVLALP